MSVYADSVWLGRTFTADQEMPWAEGVAITDGLIVAVGDRDELAALIGPDTRVERTGGLICPGLHDGHIHVLEGTLFSLQCDLHGFDSTEAYLQEVAAYAANLPAGAWVLGGGWGLAAFPDASPQASDLDAVTGGRPAYLVARDGHTAWVNTAGLELAGITAGTADPVGGRIDRGPDGLPSGALHEAAMKLVHAVLPSTRADQWRAALEIGQAQMHRLGVTGWLEARVDEPMLHGLLDTAAAGGLDARVAVALYWDPTRGIDQIESLRAVRAAAHGSAVLASTVKVFADGVLENETAHLLQPYEGSHGCGTANLSAPDLAAAVGACVEAGFAIHVHAVGDAATSQALDAFESAGLSPGGAGPRNQICHLQVVADRDVPRFARLGVCANVQAVWACRDQQMMEFSHLLDSPRFDQQYRFGDLASHGAEFVFGSDWRASTRDPMEQIQVALTRRPIGHPDSAPLGRGQELDLTTCLLGFTRNAARASGFGEVAGMLKPGYAGDLCVFETDPFGVPAEELASVRVERTVFAGRQVHPAPAPTPAPTPASIPAAPAPAGVAPQPHPPGSQPG